jgi:glutathione synthase/RimK-type ligase-like ATP-grasp enzyme
MRPIALATCAALPDLTDDDRLLIPALVARGIGAVPAVWDDDAVDWRAFAAVVIRSTWDYHLRQPRFLAWIDRLEALGVPLINPARVLRWNAEKTYLRDLTRAGVPVVPTRWVERDDQTPLAAILRETGWPRAVVKPAIAATAYRTWATDLVSAGADDARFRELIGDGRVLVQPFLEAIAAEGEWSLMFFRGEYAYSVLKTPRAGDFRVQSDFGGQVVTRNAGPALVAQASGVLDAAPFKRSELTYARVDGCVVDGTFVLMELEVLEPGLFLAVGPRGADDFAEAIVHTMQSRGYDDVTGVDSATPGSRQ